MKRKIIGIILCFVSIFSCLTTGCGKGQQSENMPETNQENSSGEEEQFSSYIIKDGSTDYKIVYSANATTLDSMGVEELISLVNEATGIELEKVKDNTVTYSKDSKFLVVGEVNFLEQAGITEDLSKYEATQCNIKTVDNSLFFYGGTYGALYAVYDYLEKEFNFDSFAIDEYYIDTEVKTLPLRNYDYKSELAIPMMVTPFYEIQSNTKFMRRMRYIGEHEVMGTIGEIWHNFSIAVNPNEHPEWFPYGYLCMTVDMEGVSTYLAEKVKVLLRENSNALFVCFSQEDGPGKWCPGGSKCQCDDCKIQYGTDSAAYIKLFNMVAEKVDNAMKDPNDLNMPNREFHIVIMAYNASTNPPIKTNPDGTYSPIDDSVICHDRLAVMLAPYYITNWCESLQSSQNDTVRKVYEQWTVITKTMQTWTYANYFVSERHLPFSRITHIKEDMEVLVDSGVVWWINQARITEAPAGMPDWSRLYIYLQSKLSRNMNYDVNELIDKFFAYYFKDAAPIMFEIFNDEQAWLRIIQDRNPNDFGSVEDAHAILSESNWSYPMLINWLDKIEEAKEQIKKYELYDHDLYVKLNDRIVLESIPVRLIIAKAFRSKFASSEAYEQFVKEYNADIARLNIQSPIA